MKIFYATLNDNDLTGLDSVALVTYPAVEHNFLCFDKETAKVKFAKNDVQHTITGVAMLADTPIYRYDQINGEYWIVFSKDTIKDMVVKFSKKGLLNSVNLQHDDNQVVDGCYMFESYLVDKERGICPVEFQDVPDGSWIISYKITDVNLWNDIVNKNDLNGFSIQGCFELSPEKEQPKEEPDPIDSLINKILE